jgi:hypothetical protein
MNILSLCVTIWTRAFRCVENDSRGTLNHWIMTESWNSKDSSLKFGSWANFSPLGLFREDSLTPFLWTAISTIGLILCGAHAWSSSCPTHTTSHTKRLRESHFHLQPPHQHVGAHHPMARLPRPHISPSTTPWPHYPPFVAVKFVVCSERSAIFPPQQSCDLWDNHT